MKTNMFIIIVSGYSILLGGVALFFLTFSLEYFAGEPNDLQQHSLVNYIGGYQIAFGGLGYFLWKTIDGTSRKS